MIIGISGKPGNGKDFLANLFVTQKNFKRESLGDRIREITIQVTGLSMETLRSHETKDVPLKEFDNKTPREITIEIGEAIESVLGLNVWCEMTDRLINDNENLVFPDIRTPLQANWIKSKGGLLIRIQDDSGPHKYKIENMLDDYQEWDFIIEKEIWFKDSQGVFDYLITKL